MRKNSLLRKMSLGSLFCLLGVSLILGGCFSNEIDPKDAASVARHIEDISPKIKQVRHAKNRQNGHNYFNYIYYDKLSVPMETVIADICTAIKVLIKEDIIRDFDNLTYSVYLPSTDSTGQDTSKIAANFTWTGKKAKELVKVQASYANFFNNIAEGEILTTLVKEFRTFAEDEQNIIPYEGFINRVYGRK